MYPQQDILQAPWPLQTAISHALSILSWYELPEEDRPSEEIWLNPEKLEIHFEDIKDRRERESRDGDFEEPIGNEITENPAAKAWRK